MMRRHFAIVESIARESTKASPTIVPMGSPAVAEAIRQFNDAVDEALAPVTEAMTDAALVAASEETSRKLDEAMDVAAFRLGIERRPSPLAPSPMRLTAPPARHPLTDAIRLEGGRSYRDPAKRVLHVNPDDEVHGPVDEIRVRGKVVWRRK
jgi:hypothetical protein